MRTACISAITLFAVCGLAACTGSPPLETVPPQAAETITVAVGPCFGFCPVYAATVTPVGLVRFDGQRHTAVLGEQTRTIDQASYRKLARDLAAFRPPSGTEAVVECTAAVSDTSTYTVTWADAAGRKTVATVQSGCPGGTGRTLVELLRGLPGRLGIADLAKQVTRPGASRG